MAIWMTTRAGCPGATRRASCGARYKPAKSNSPAPRQRTAAKADAQQRRRDGADQRKALAPLRSRLARCEKRLRNSPPKRRKLDARARRTRHLFAGPGASACRNSPRSVRAWRRKPRAWKPSGWKFSEELERAQAES